MQELSEATKKLVEKYAAWKRSLKPEQGASVIHVDEVALRVAAFYEQIRTVIDWKEEHLMRRAAITRKLQAKFVDLEFKNTEKQKIAESLIMELIRGGYFPNDKIEESKIQSVQNIVDKYIFIFSNNDHSQNSIFYGKLLEIAACEVEETLAPSIKEMALIDYMFLQMKERIKVSEKIYATGKLKPEDKDIQIYIAVQEALFKLDEPIISYNLIRYKYPEWVNPTDDELLVLSQNIYSILEVIEQDLQHPMAKKFYNICEKYDTPYLLLGDILSGDNLEKISQDIYEPGILEGLTRSAYTKRLSNLKAQIARAAVYSILSIFVTKILSLVILEVILAKVFGHPFEILFLIIDIIIPTALMALLVITVRPPSAKNLNLVIMETMKIVYKKDKPDVYEIRTSRKKGPVMRAILSMMYLAGACISFGGLYWIFYYFNFPIVSIAINFLFIALILFAGTAVKKRSRELTMEEESQGILGFFLDILFLPITEIGRFMSTTWQQYNVIIALFNALIDMPFSTFVEFLERWRYFIKERKEDMQ